MDFKGYWLFVFEIKVFWTTVVLFRTAKNQYKKAQRPKLKVKIQQKPKTHNRKGDLDKANKKVPRGREGEQNLRTIKSEITIAIEGPETPLLASLSTSPFEIKVVMRSWVCTDENLCVRDITQLCMNQDIPFCICEEIS